MQQQNSNNSSTNATTEENNDIGNINCYKWDSKLKLSDPTFMQKIHTRNFDSKTAASDPIFPTDYLLGRFAQLAYEKSNYTLPEGWELLTTATNTNIIIPNGYFGVAFWNPKLCQIVVAHRGTKWTSIGALISDLKLALNKGKTRQSQSAATFVHLISTHVKKANLSENGPHIYLAITGHSLGAWLAQITTFTVKYFKKVGTKFIEDENYLSNIHPHTVVFESPGCKQAFEELVRYFVPRYMQRKYGNYDSLDMTVYLSRLNPINSINEHVGTIYSIQSQTHAIKDALKLFNPKTGYIEKERVLDFRSGMLASSMALFKKLVPCSNIKIIKQPVNENEYSLNVFNEKELDFVKDWVHIVNLKLREVEYFEEEKKLPKFKVDEEYNVIISLGQNIYNIISHIKRMRPTKTVILELMKNGAKGRVHYEIFKLKTQQFQKELLQFRNYYFQDKYKVKQFFTSKNKILHIQVNQNAASKFELETSILNSVLTFYKNTEPALVENYFSENRYGFITWQKLEEVLNIVPDMFKQYEVTLLVVDCFEIENTDKIAILKFLKEVDIKLILLSTDEVSWKNEITDIQETDGFGGNIKFENLTADCQRKFFTEKNLMLYGEKKSLHDIVGGEFPFSEEVYQHLNRAISPDVLLELLLTPITEAIVMDCPFNLPKGFFYELYQEVDLYKLRNLISVEQSLFIIESNNNPDWLPNDGNDLNLIVEDKVDFVKKCLENFDKTVYLLSVENDKIYLTKIFNKEFYISRKIAQQKFIDSDVFKDLSDDFDQYYVCGNKQIFNKYLTVEKRDQFIFYRNEDAAKRKVKSSKSNIHVLKVEDEKIEWLYSYGSIEYLRKYVTAEKHYVEENRITAIEDIVIISGEPGSGKSSTIELQYLLLQKLKTHWVFVVPLRYLVFENIDAAIDYDYVAKFILKTCGISYNECVQHLLAYCLKYETNLPVYLLFDGFEETDKSNRKKFIDIVNFLKYSSNAKTKILITTRKYKCRELENGISVFASHFEPLDNKTKVTFLINFWKCWMDVIEEVVSRNVLEESAWNMLHDAEDMFGDSIAGFIGIPMHLRMMAEVMPPNSSLTTTNVLTLFQKYIETRYNLYFKKIGFTKNETAQKWLSNAISGKFYQLAITKLFETNITHIGYDDIEGLNNVGVIQSNPDDILKYEFLHDSVRDYFVAYLLKLWLEPRLDTFCGDWDTEKFIISEFLLLPEYKLVRLFLNYDLNNFRRLKTCRNRLQELWDNDKNLFFIDEESAFHVCVQENLSALIKYFLCPLTDGINNVDLLSKRNSDLKTPLYLALSSPFNSIVTESSLTILLETLEQYKSDDIKIVLESTLFTYLVSEEYINNFKKYLKNYENIKEVLDGIESDFKKITSFLEFCSSNNYVELDQLMKQYQNDKITKNYLLLVTNNRKETGLHLTTNTEIVKRLLELGINKNAQDYHGMTPLARAIKNGDTEIASILIKNGADTRIVDYLSNSPLHHSAKYDKLDTAKLLLTTKFFEIDINACNIYRVTPLMLAAKNGNRMFVTYLLDKGADVHAADWNGMTALYHAVKGDSTDIVRVLKQRAADVNVADEYGISPLLYSIKKSRWNMINALIDNGANVNEGNQKVGYPLQLLLNMNRPAIIKKIFKASEIIEKPVITNMLTEAENKILEKIQSSK